MSSPVPVLGLLALLGPATALAQAAPFTLVALPDTQFYTCDDGSSCVASEDIFATQTEWIVANREALDIRFVTGLGDCVQDGDVVPQYRIADDALSLLEEDVASERPDGIPFGLAVGNRDQEPSGDPGSLSNPGSTTTVWNDWFGLDRFCPDGDCRSYYGDHYGGNNDNHYDLFEVNGYRFVVVHVEFMEFDSDLRRDVLDWADDVLDEHADRRAIVVSHYVMKTGVDGPFSDQGQALYDRLKQHENLFLMLGGHITGEGRRTDTLEGRKVHTVLADYQGREDGGAGFLRLLEFVPEDDEIRVRTYSPWLDAYETDGSSEFTLAYDMDGGEVEPPDPCAGAADTDGDGVCDPLDACAGDDAFPDHDGDGICNAGLTAGTLGRGQLATLTLRNAAPGAPVGFVASLSSAEGPRRCATGGTPCTTLQKTLVLATGTAGADGVATAQILVPTTVAAGRTIWLQGWQGTASGGGQTSPLVAAVVQ